MTTSLSPSPRPLVEQLRDLLPRGSRIYLLERHHTRSAHHVVDVLVFLEHGPVSLAAEFAELCACRVVKPGVGIQLRIDGQHHTADWLMQTAGARLHGDPLAFTWAWL